MGIPKKGDDQNCLFYFLAMYGNTVRFIPVSRFVPGTTKHPEAEPGRSESFVHLMHIKLLTDPLTLGKFRSKLKSEFHSLGPSLVKMGVQGFFFVVLLIYF